LQWKSIAFLKNIYTQLEIRGIKKNKACKLKLSTLRS
jgi:hypothetical protein